MVPAGPIEEQHDDLLHGPWADPLETAIVDDWRKTKANNAARLARVARRLGELDVRLR